MYDSRVDGYVDDGFLIFATDHVLDRLRRSRAWSGDGTFKGKTAVHSLPPTYD